MRISSKGQITIPSKIRKQLHLLPDTEVEFEVFGDLLVMRKARVENRSGRMIVEHLRGRASSMRTTDEIMALTRGD
jgi:antitoxin PrlF